MMQTASRVKLPYLKVERDAEVDAPRKRKRDKLVKVEVKHEGVDKPDPDGLNKGHNTKSVKCVADMKALPAAPEEAYTLNPEQRASFKFIMRTLRHVRELNAGTLAAAGGDRQRQQCYVANMSIVGAAGTGKSHLLRCILAAAAAEGAATLPTASSAAAAHALGGVTTHAAFGLCDHGALARVDCTRIREAELIVIDEAMLLRADHLDAVVGDVLQRARFAGVVLLAVNPAGMLPLQIGGTKAARVARSIVSAACWPKFRDSKWQCTLTQQMRIKCAALAEAVRGLGDGTATAHYATESAEGCTQAVALPPGVFTQVCSADRAQRWLLEGPPGALPGMVICTTNYQVEEHNDAVLRLLPGVAKVYRISGTPELPERQMYGRVSDPYSGLAAYADEGCEATSHADGTSECGSDISADGEWDEVLGARARVVEHVQQTPFARQPKQANCDDELHLKVGALVRVACNVCVEEGLFTEALATVVALGADTVTVRMVSPRPGAAEIAEFGRLQYADGVYQFPLKLAYAVTAHRAAAFTPERAVVDLRGRGCWAHGQLATMLSRAPSLLVLHDGGFLGSSSGGVTTQNVVLREVIAGVQ